MSETSYFKTELIEILGDSNNRVAYAPNHILENICDYVIMTPFKEEIDSYRSALLRTMMDILYEEIKRLTLAQQEVIYHHFFLQKRLKHLSQELHLRIPTIVERKEGALKKLKKRLTRNPIFISLYQEYIQNDLP